MSPAPTWFLRLLRWYVLLPVTVCVTLAAPRLPKAVFGAAPAGVAEGGSLLYTLLAYVLLFTFAQGARQSLRAPHRAALPWPLLAMAMVVIFGCLAASAWLTVLPGISAPPFGLIGAFAWCRAMLMAAMVGPAMTLDELADAVLAARRRAPVRR
jgi:hypothetical protein